MFCEKCGTKLEEGSLFCDNCGAKLADMVVVPPASDNNQETIQVTGQPENQNNEQVVYQQAPQGYQPMPVVAKSPMAKSTKLFITELIVFVMVVIALFKIGQTRFGADYVAENYAKAKMAGDWNAVYEMLNLPTSSLLTKEMFVASRTDEELMEIANYEIEENKNSNNNFRTSYTCEYMTNGDSYSHSENIVLVKQRDKQWLFFDKWEVTPDDMIVEEAVITVPFDATLLFNGVDVSTLAGVEKEEENNNITYKLPKIFAGTYDIEVQAPGRKPYMETVNIRYYFSNYYTNLEPDKAVVEELVKDNSELCNKFWNAVMEGKSYDDFYSENATEFGKDVDFRYFYENWLHSFENNDYYQYNNVTVDNIEARLDDYGIDYETGEFYIVICQTGNVTYEGIRIRTSWWSNEVTREPYNGSSGFYEYAKYTLHDGEWIITRLGN